MLLVELQKLFVGSSSVCFRRIAIVACRCRWHRWGDLLVLLHLLLLLLTVRRLHEA
jgi:hypothetical protein